MKAPELNADIEALIPSVRGLARKLLGKAANEDSIDEIAQEGLAELVQKKKQYDSSRGASLWTFSKPAVLRRMLGSKRKHAQRNITGRTDNCASPIRYEELTEAHEPIDNAPSPEDFAVEHSRQAAMQTALMRAMAAAKLTDREAAVIRMRFWGEGFQQEIGALYGISDSTVQGIEKSALIKLRAALGPKAVELLRP